MKNLTRKKAIELLLTKIDTYTETELRQIVKDIRLDRLNDLDNTCLELELYNLLKEDYNIIEDSQYN